MQEQDIIALLTQVGHDLEELGLEKPVRLLLVGGAYMVTQVQNRLATKDIDAALLEGNRWGEAYDLFKRVMAFNLTEIGGEPDWFSDDITEFLPEMGLPKTTKRWLVSGKLEVYIPEPGYILALKFLATRPKDEADIRTLLAMLKIKRRRQAENLVKKYVSANIREVYAAKLEKALNDFFS